MAGAQDGVVVGRRHDPAGGADDLPHAASAAAVFFCRCEVVVGSSSFFLSRCSCGCCRAPPLPPPAPPPPPAARRHHHRAGRRKNQYPRPWRRAVTLPPFPPNRKMGEHARPPAAAPPAAPTPRADANKNGPPAAPRVTPSRLGLPFPRRRRGGGRRRPPPEAMLLEHPHRAVEHDPVPEDEERPGLGEVNNGGPGAGGRGDPAPVEDPGALHGGSGAAGDGVGSGRGRIRARARVRARGAVPGVWRRPRLVPQRRELVRGEGARLAAAVGAGEREGPAVRRDDPPDELAVGNPDACIAPREFHEFPGTKQGPPSDSLGWPWTETTRG